MVRLTFPRLGIILGAVLLVAGCASLPSSAELDRMAQQAHRDSFSSRGIAKAERIQQDRAQAACSSDQPPTAAVAQAIESEALKSVKWPSNGQFLGDWRAGEALAQSGRGMTWSDASADPKDNGANCYNCHQIGKAEISFGTIGPSLYNYGKLRGVANPADPAARPIVEYTWGKLYNAKAYSACSNMPRFGHMGILNEAQLRHLMALLLDPQSPVNQ
jgi:L-cysteine S-thiosulfotransferase